MQLEVAVRMTKWPNLRKIFIVWFVSPLMHTTLVLFEEKLILITELRKYSHGSH